MIVILTNRLSGNQADMTVILTNRLLENQPDMIAILTNRLLENQPCVTVILTNRLLENQAGTIVILINHQQEANNQSQQVDKRLRKDTISLRRGTILTLMLDESTSAPQILTNHHREEGNVNSHNQILTNRQLENGCQSICLTLINHQSGDNERTSQKVESFMTSTLVKL